METCALHLLEIPGRFPSRDGHGHDLVCHGVSFRLLSKQILGLGSRLHHRLRIAGCSLGIDADCPALNVIG